MRVVLIDSPDFTHRIARAVKKRDPSIRTVNYVAPQVWASRAYRAQAMARYFDLVLALFPFEVPFFEKYGLQAVFVGHPVIERAARMTGGAALRARLGIARGCAAAGRCCPAAAAARSASFFRSFAQAVALLAKSIPGLVTVLPTVPHVAAQGARSARPDWPTPLHILEGEADKFAAFDAADVALAASGTVTAELALARTPMVVAYRVGGLTYALAHRLMTVPYHDAGQYPAGPRGGAGIHAVCSDARSAGRRRWRRCSATRRRARAQMRRWTNSPTRLGEGERGPIAARRPGASGFYRQRGPPKCSGSGQAARP